MAANDEAASLKREGRQEKRRLRQETSGPVPSLDFEHQEMLEFNLDTVTSLEPRAAQTYAKDEPANPEKAAQPNPSASSRKCGHLQLHAKRIEGEVHLFLSANGQLVLDIHTGNEMNVRLCESDRLLARLTELASEKGQATVLVVHGHKHGNAWMKRVREYFGNENCDFWKGRCGITEIRLKN